MKSSEARIGGLAGMKDIQSALENEKKLIRKLQAEENQLQKLRSVQKKKRKEKPQKNTNDFDFDLDDFENLNLGAPEQTASVEESLEENLEESLDQFENVESNSTKEKKGKKKKVGFAPTTEEEMPIKGSCLQ